MHQPEIRTNQTEELPHQNRFLDKADQIKRVSKNSCAIRNKGAIKKPGLSQKAVPE